ncbi:MAG: hypothetical protein R2941_23120 [Desulfobacterales bacterium]
MAKKYKRYYEIPVQKCNGECPGKGEDVLKITLFNKYDNLRSHAVKHLASRSEPLWIEKLDADAGIINRSIIELQNIACQYFTAKLLKPQCNKKCPSFNRCTSCVTKLANEYLRIIRKVLEDGCAKPRYACFYSNRYADGENSPRIFCTMADQPVVIKSALLDENSSVYNLTTAYTANAWISFSEMLKKQREKIANEAKANSIHWCNPSQWGFIPFQPSKTVPRDWREVLKEMGEQS